MGRVSWVGVFYLFIFLFYLSYDCNFVLNIQEQKKKDLNQYIYLYIISLYGVV